MSYADILRNAYFDAARAAKTCMIDEERQKAENIDHCVYWNIYSYQKTA